MDTKRRKLLLGGGALLAGGILATVHAVSGKGNALTNKVPAIAQPRLGINFSGIAYWSTELPFANLMHQSSEWVSQPPHGDWGKGPALALDQHGWVTHLKRGCRATKILAAAGAPYPKGEYTVLYDGEGEIALTNPIGHIKKQGSGQLSMHIDKDGMFAIDIIATNPDNYLRNIRVIMPGLAAQNPWNPDFLARWSGVACIRVMDMMATNNSTQKTWADRPQVNDASYAHKGVPIALLVDLANQLNADIWFCMPHMVDDDYVKAFATLANRLLKPALRIWVEYSNEVWNGGFAQFSYAAQQGKKLNLSKNQWEAAFKYNAHRSVEIFNIWQSVIASKKRLVNVIASQASNAGLSTALLKHSDLAKLADVLAIAPYISLNVPVKADAHGLSADSVASWSLNQLFEYLKTVRLPSAKKSIIDTKKVAETYGLQLVAYEAGQHLVGVQGGENNAQLTKLFMQANADKRMGDLYQQHLQDWDATGGDLWCAFNSMSGWSKWGSWGLLEAPNKPTAKYKATIQWATAKGQKMRVMP